MHHELGDLPRADDAARSTSNSLLFDEARPVTLAEAPPRSAKDLNVDQILQGITAGRDEYDLLPLFSTPLDRADAVAYRQAVFRDLDGTPARDAVAAFAEAMRSMRRHLAQAEAPTIAASRQRWFLDAARIYCDAVATLADQLASAQLGSRALQGLRDQLAAHVASSAFTTLRAEQDAVTEALDGVAYSVHISGTRVRVSPYEGEDDYSAEVVRTFEKFAQHGVDASPPTLPASTGMNHVQARILELVAKLHPEAFAQLDRFCQRHHSFVDPAVATFDREVQFYVAYLEHIAPLRAAGLSFAYPQVAERARDVHAHETFDLALASQLVGDRQAVVCNDIALSGRERILVVTGANQGGKTTFARTFGQLHYLAGLGCPVPGRTASLSLFDEIHTHFEQGEDIHSLRGRLKDDLVRMREILDAASERSIIILNEPFESTTLKDAAWLGQTMLERIAELDALCVVVTFIDELTRVGDKTVSMVAGVAPEDPARRTLRVERRPADGLAHALALAEKHHLTYDQLRQRLAS